MRVLGIDPGTGRVGWSIVSKEKGVESLVECGCFETPKNSPLPSRLKLIYDFLTKLIKEHEPDEFAAENLFFSTNAKTAFDVGAARGVILLAAENAGLPIFQYTPLQVKSSLTGYGAADKKQVQFMITRILHLKVTPKPDDAADAVAIALTHLFTQKHPIKIRN
ncbi:MAG: Crossover junction endodeoxyribonuclease RuvC [Candidatus Collierbacteria bacterium GW2011_GWB1_44_35]|uniref:Crossover junction endodeoxyribonuclease RuvC n=4 Tax=Candidatus Collieribacteriota TaxID=1752725 RepID=A0A0G1JSB1_9BACT|nr:MAG: Crossover junction endodeoxyribonuclease RuvC [Candidatus Collierbacteria bacterium GW2011_GWA1_44_12]KKT37525.1 MAG: Crossover junction endodeoxyribonuclease RuvC [Candidatus Collierbacteria bacterium GW2011_GWF1_44_12]KKT46792.1 MAG: Crossover junction endodeoxyribonuclease RuvC [Candidatus Collierbacteria bacterium GW2011_GWF2_44_15]KKT67856.1 MAG: Crossover junction endodeoxyribonuclease RuvC [Candidatus Collierbacteria bacterium GW2011_GWB1_44_35]